MRALVLLLQIVVSVVVTALCMPVLLATVPAARERPLGLAAVAVIAGLTFAGLRVVWPKRQV